MIKSLFNPAYLSFLGKTTYVLGHKNPDTDSVCSAISQAKLQDELKEDPDDVFLPTAAGKLNAETEFALKYFGIKQPKIVEDLSVKVEDMIEKEPISEVCVSPDTTLREFGDLIIKHNAKTLPVVDKEKNIVGMVSMKNLAELYLSKVDLLSTLKEKNIQYGEIAKVLNGKVLTGQLSLNKTIQGNVKIGAYSPESMEESNFKGATIITGDREDIQQKALEGGAKAIVVTKNHPVSPKIIKMAKERNAIIISTQHGVSTTTKLLEQSIPVREIMSKYVLSIDAESKIDDIKNKVKSNNYRFFPVTKNGKFIGVVSRDKILSPDETEVILVDHNSPNQFASGIKKENVVGIVDHHRQEFITDSRIPITYGNVGASATLIAQEYRANSVKIPKEIAGILWCAIISDTDKFTSTTTTKKDILTAQELANIAEIEEPDQLADTLLTQRDIGLDKLTPTELIHYDLKQFDTTNDKTYSIGQITTFIADKYLSKKDGLFDALNKLDNNSNIGSVFAITDLSQSESYLVCSTKIKQQAKKAISQDDGRLGKININDSMTYLDVLKEIANSKERVPVVRLQNIQSRKEQIEPFIRKIYEF